MHSPLFSPCRVHSCCFHSLRGLSCLSSGLLGPLLREANTQQELWQVLLGSGLSGFCGLCPGRKVKVYEDSLFSFSDSFPLILPLKASMSPGLKIKVSLGWHRQISSDPDSTGTPGAPRLHPQCLGQPGRLQSSC